MGEETAEKDKREVSGAWVAAPFVVVAALALYFFSAVPVAFVFYSAGMDFMEKPFQLFYAPVMWLYENNELAETILEKQAALMGMQ